MPMPPLERKVALMRAGITQSEIARRVGVSNSHVGDVLHGHRRSAQVEAAIADAIGKPVADVFEPAPEKAGAAA